MFLHPVKCVEEKKSEDLKKQKLLEIGRVYSLEE